MQIGTNIQILRKAQGMQQAQLASKVGISPKHLSEIENGHKYPRWELLCRILKSLSATIELQSEIPCTTCKGGKEQITLRVETAYS